MANSIDGPDSSHPNLNLTADEKRVYGKLFQDADTENVGVVTGDVAVKFFEKSRLEPRILGEIWQIADTENRGFLTPAGFGLVLRLIGHVQAGREPSPELGLRPGPLPKFDGFGGPAIPPVPPPPAKTLQAQSSGGPIRVPPLTPEKANEYAALFEKFGSQNGILPGDQAKQIFEKARLPNEVLGRIWNLADTELRGALGVTEFIIAMHLLASYKSGTLPAVPTILPPGLYDAALRRGATRTQQGGPSPSSSRQGDLPPISGVPRQFSGLGAQRAQSPLARPSYTTPPESAQTTGGGDWVINATEKTQFDNVFASLDGSKRGFITGDEAVGFFGNSRLPEEILAQIWDLADINSEGRLNRDEFAVAMYLIRQQRGTRDGRGSLPSSLPPQLVPPSMRQQTRPPQQPTAPVFDNEAYATTKSASEDLFGLDAFSPPPTSSPPQSGPSASYSRPFPTDAFGNVKKPVSSTGSQSPQESGQQSSVFKPFVPSSSFGQNLASNSTGESNHSGRRLQQSQPSAADDLLGDNDPEESKKLTAETTELGNLSNQVGTLSKQMQEVKSKRVSTEQDLSKTGSQKRDFELRLSQLRSLYEQEVKEVKALDERLRNSRDETRKLQQDIAMIEGTYQDLQNQHRQATEALDADQRENTSLKEKMRIVNLEINQLRPQLDKLRSDARQQKGLVAINKKQLSTNEGEKEKIRGEIEEAEASKVAQDRSRSMSSSSQAQTPIPGASPTPSTTSQSTNPFFRRPSAMSADREMSPAPFTPGGSTQTIQNQNTFESVFGAPYSSQPTSEPPPTSFGADSPSENPQTTSPPLGQSVPSTEVPGPATQANFSPASTFPASPQPTDPPAPPESRQITSNLLPFKNNDLQASDSRSSSVNVSAPASRYGGNDLSRTETPTNWATSEAETPIQERDDLTVNFGRADTSDTTRGLGSAFPDTDYTSTNPTQISDLQTQRHSPNRAERQNSYQSLGTSNSVKESIPGAFPGEVTTPIETTPTGGSALSDRSKNSTRPSEGFRNHTADPFSANVEPSRGSANNQDDFNAAFASFGAPRQSQDRQNTGGSSADGSVGTGPIGANKFNKEFPPIEEFGNDDESDSASERGFDDDFTNSTPQRNKTSVGTAQVQSNVQPEPSSLEDPTATSAPRPPLATVGSNASGQLPTPGAQKSPPSYDQTMSPPGEHSPRGSNQFPPEFSGLLPSREDPTSPHETPEKASGSLSTTGGQALFGGSNASKGAPSSVPTAFSSSPPASDTPASTAPSDAYQSAVSQHPSAETGPLRPDAQAARPNVPFEEDEFDQEFADLADAKEADDKGDDDFAVSSQDREGFDEFNPVFDSPAPSKSNTLASSQMTTRNPAEESFNDFERSVSGPTQASTQQNKIVQPPAAANHDWDAIFAGLDSPGGSSAAGQQVGGGGQTLSSPTEAPINGRPGSGPLSTQVIPGSGGGEGLSSSAGTQPPHLAQLGRALSTGTEHDDPILKKLTGMGYDRDDALGALERYDYNIDKAADFLVRNVQK
ncbi:MAG: hypothetical protein M1837_004299 [Sclerophora amabilis]|nr:MAG: hypothetical protein M1837_004299 [Sclerophora amabilis]